MRSEEIVPFGKHGSGPRVCLAASGGGHLRQLLELESVWRERPCFFVTEDSALSRSIAEQHLVHTVEHFALGQARLGHPLKMLRAAFVNLRQSLRIIRAEHPDILVTTGAGAMFWVALFARMGGARIILIDSFARFHAPSKFARVTRRFAQHVVVQSAALKLRWPDAELFDPLRIIEGEAPHKEPLLFATVGVTLAFPRLVEAVLALKRSGAVNHRILLQIGDDKRPASVPDGVEIVHDLDFNRLRAILDEADIVVCHGGTGSLITALSAGCHVIAMPRSFARGEHYDDHQEEITTAFAERGLITIARDDADLARLVGGANDRKRVMARTDPDALMTWLERKLAD